jgi:hypothetical protein
MSAWASTLLLVGLCCGEHAAAASSDQRFVRDWSTDDVDWPC